MALPMKKNKVLIPFLVATLVFSTVWFVAPTPDAYAQVAPRKIRLFAGFKLTIVKTKLKVAQIEVAAGEGESGPPTVTTATSVPASNKGVVPLETITWANVSGSITAIGGSAPTVRGFAWSFQSSGLIAGVATTTENGSFGTGIFYSICADLITGDTGVTLYYRAYATNSFGTGYGTIESDPMTPLSSWFCSESEVT